MIILRSGGDGRGIIISSAAYLKTWLAVSSSFPCCNCSYQRRDSNVNYFNWRKRPWRVSPNISPSSGTPSSSPIRYFSTCSPLGGRKRDYHAEEKLPSKLCCICI